MSDFVEKAKELGLTIYVPDFNQDATLANWYKFLIENGDFVKVFSESQKPLSKFMKIFETPCVLVYAIDDEGDIWNAIWFTPFGDEPTASFVGYWTREGMRGSKKHLAVTKLVYSMAFQFFSVLIGVTKHEHLLRIHRKLGYNILGKIPYFMEGGDGWVLYLTEEDFINSKVYKVGQ